MPLIGLVCWLASWPAAPEGISARFGQDTAVIGQDVVLRVEVTDPLGVVKRVEVAVRGRNGTWHTRMAFPDTEPADRIGATRPADTVWWRATFTSTTVWSRQRTPALAARARLVGARGGVLLALGEPEPLTIEAVTPAEAAQRQRVFALARTDAESPVVFSGYVGADGRAGTSARARIYLGFGARLNGQTELIGSIAIGPAFARPPATAGGGPIVLGGDVATRFYTRALDISAWSLFAGPFGTVDLRFAGVDVGGGFRAGVTWAIQRELALEVALSGAVMGFGVVATKDDAAGVGFVGGLRVGLRFGATAPEGPLPP